MERDIDSFAPRLWRANKALAKKIFGYVVFPVNIPYNAEKFIRWYLPAELKDIETFYWDYVEFCEESRGEAATNCRCEASQNYLKPFTLEHYIFYEFKKKNFVIGR